MIKIISNGSKWAGQQPATIEELLTVLAKYPLDPTFEKYGNFINPHPTWLKKEAAELYKGCTTIFGNFMECSHVFNVITDDSDTIAALSKAIEANKETAEYKAFKQRIAETEQKKEKAKRLFEKGKINLKEMYAMY